MSTKSIVHHRDCDEWRHHSRRAIQTSSGGWKPACSICGELEVIGAFGSESGALGYAAAHETFEACIGQCQDWD